MPTRTSRPRSTTLVVCWASRVSRPPRLVMADCWPGCGPFGTVGLVGVEGTGSYGAGLTRHLNRAGVRVVRGGPLRTARSATAPASPTLSTLRARRAPALSGKAKGAPRGRDGTVEAIRALMVVKRSARGERTRSIQSGQSPCGYWPDDLRSVSKVTHRRPGRRAGRPFASPRRCRRLRHSRRAERTW